MPESAKKSVLTEDVSDGNTTGVTIGVYLSGDTLFIAPSKPYSYEIYAQAESSNLFKSSNSYAGTQMASVTEITFENFNTSNTTSMESWFSGCRALTSLTGIGNFDTSKVTAMNSTFYNCTKLTSLTGIENWDVSEVTTMRSMFNNCSSLTSLPNLKKWDTGKVNSMYYMFLGCSSLTSLTGIENWDVSEVTTMYKMFNGCSELTTLDISGWKISTDKLTDTREMFANSSKLATIYASVDGDGTEKPNFTGTKLSNSSNMFAGCINLKGGNGTQCDGGNNIDKTYARIDKDGQLGYFTDVSTKTTG